MAKVGRPKETSKGESEHPGVKLLIRKRATKTTYIARWADPVLSKPEPIIGDDGDALKSKGGRIRTRMRYVWVEQSLTALGLGGPKQGKARKQWCKRKSAWLTGQRQLIEAGEAIVTETPVSTAVADYYKSAAKELRPGTLVVYRQGSKPFETWCATQGVPFIELLTPAKLTAFREWFIGRPAHVPVRGTNVGRGTRREGRRKKTAAQENKCLRSVRAMLSKMRKRGVLPHLHSDDITDCLSFVKAERSKPKYLNTDQVRALLSACQRHDAAGHEPIATFTAAALLTGCRFMELADLEWSEVDVRARQITLPATRTKTGRERTIDLSRMPSLVSWLSRAKLASGSQVHVFPAITRGTARAARSRLSKEFESGPFTWHRLRATCGTYSVCASLYGRNSISETAQQLGHGVQVAVAHYTGRAKDFAPDADTLERAMACEDLFDAIARTTKHAAGHTDAA